jgi:hypothetical protein
MERELSKALEETMKNFEKMDKKELIGIIMGLIMSKQIGGI